MDRSGGSATIHDMPACQRCSESNPEQARVLPRLRRRAGGTCAARGARSGSACCSRPGRLYQPRQAAKDVRGLLSSYYARLRIDLERYGATVEKFIGDTVMALFGAPSARGRPDGPCGQRFSIHQAIAAFNEAGRPWTCVRIGVTTGEALVAPDASPRPWPLATWSAPRPGCGRRPRSTASWSTRPPWRATERRSNTGQPRRSPPELSRPGAGVAGHRAAPTSASTSPTRRLSWSAGAWARPVAQYARSCSPRTRRLVTPWSASGIGRVSSSGSCCSRSRPSQS